MTMKRHVAKWLPREKRSGPPPKVAESGRFRAFFQHPYTGVRGRRREARHLLFQVGNPTLYQHRSQGGPGGGAASKPLVLLRCGAEIRSESPTLVYDMLAIADHECSRQISRSLCASESYGSET